MNGIRLGRLRWGAGASRGGRSTPRALLTSLLLVLFVTVGAAQEIGDRSPADDLPPELKLLMEMCAERDYRWTRIGKNEKAREQEAMHPEFNAVSTLWHLPLASNRAAFKLVFAHPIRTGSNVFHLYIEADGDETTGRNDGSIHQGVDYMFTLLDGDPRHRSTRLDVFEADGRGRRGACSVLIRDDTLYLVAEMTLRQHEGHSVFDFFVSSYVRDGGPSASLAYRRAVSDPAPETVDTRLLANPELVLVNGTVPGWQLVGSGAEAAGLTTATEEDAVVIDHLYAGGALLQSVNLSPGHYLLRALVKTDTFATHLGALGYRIPVGVRDEYRWSELPFYVTASDRAASRRVEVGLWHVGYPPTRHHGEIRVKEIQLRRLGDTALPDRWAETLPVDPLHRLKLLAASPAWNRPGKVVFQDAFIGTELWLMTQEGQVDHSYVGHPDFSHEGKYLHIGLRRQPRGLIRTDGSDRHLNDAWGGLVWLFPWEQKRLPEGTPAVDWIVTSRPRLGSPGLFTPPIGVGEPEQPALQSAGSELLNVITGATHQIALPSRPGWRIVHFPGIASYGGRGPKMQEIDHDALVWFAEDNRSLGRSDMDGQGFVEFPVSSISSEPQDDTLETAMSSVWGKAGDNWRDAVDHDGNRYFLFERNRENLPDHPTNPYQVWALPLTEDDDRGLLRVVFNPKVQVTEFLSTQSGLTPQPSFNWWDFAAGLPRSGDNAVLLLSDGTRVHMSSLGMHSSFRDTVHTACADSGQVTFFGSYPRLDRITWPHEFRRDRDFAVVASHAEPASPLVMLDLEHATIGTLALTNFHDYAIRYKTRWDQEAYHKPMFRPAPTFSPDFTKVVYFSSMLTGDHPDRIWGDMYVAVARYPEPPVHLRHEENSLVWERPRRSAEIKGFRLYRSHQSGGNYERVGDRLLTGTRYELPTDATGFYVLTSVEYSGLEGRRFSNEVNVGSSHIFRHYHRPAAGRIVRPMVPVFDPTDTADGYAVAVTDPELVYEQPEGEQRPSGSVVLQVAIPEAGPVRILARVRGMSALERSSYTSGWDPSGEAGRGRFVIRIDGKELGVIPVKGFPWGWVALDTDGVRLPEGDVELQISTRDAGIAMDNLLVTNDPDFVPQRRGQVPEELAATPDGLRVEPLRSDVQPAASEWFRAQQAIVKLVWNPVAPPQGVSHYNVYRCEAESFTAEPETLLGSPGKPVFYDVGLAAGQTVYYRVRAVDAWGNQSPASAPFPVHAD